MKLLIILLSVSVLVSCSETSSQQVDTSIETSSSSEQTNSKKIGQESASEFKATEVDSEVTDYSEEMETADMPNAEVDEELIEIEDMPASDKALVELASTEEVEEKIVEIEESVEPLRPNHDNWDGMLRKNVSSSGKVNYSGMKSGSKELDAYVAYLESFITQDGWSRNEKLAYWINLYNAATVQLIVKNYPVASITDLSGGKPWDQNIIKIGPKSYSLNDIENKIIRPRFNDGRIHFAVNCAAKSCPPLMNKAFTASSLSRQLEKQTTAFINSSENTIAADKVVISKIFDWYKVDFKKGDVISFLNKYSTTPINEDAEITYREYNWDLNK